MENQSLLNILVAVVLAHSAHSLFEPINIRGKVSRLVAYMDNKPFEEMSMKIDTRAKAYALGFAFFSVVALISYGIVSLIDPSLKSASIFAVVVLLTVEVVNTVAIDKYHVEIEQVTKRFKK